MEVATVRFARPADSWYAPTPVGFLGSWLRKPAAESHADEVDPARHVAKVLRGDRAAAERLVIKLLPPVQRRVAWVLQRHGRGRREDVLDFAQDTLVRLFEDDHRVLRTWDPARGASLETFAALVAERHVLTVLRSGRKGGGREDPTADTDRVLGADPVDLERRVFDQDALRRILDRLESELTPRSRELFVAVFVDGEPLEQVAERFAMSSNALYSWSSRLRARVHAIAAELGVEREVERT